MLPVPDAAIDALDKAWARGAHIASICASAFTLAAAGLLDGRRATTHWRAADLLVQRYPADRALTKIRLGAQKGA